MSTLNLGVASSMGGQLSVDALTATPQAPADPASWVAPSWDEIVRLHADRVYRLAYRLSGNRADAEDLTQETFVRVFRSLADYTPGTFEGWLHRITTNLFLDMVRRRQKIRFDALADDASERLASDEPGPERAYEQNNLDPEIQRALDTLPADFRAAVVLCDLEGLTYEEIALTLGIKVGTVRSRIHRGRVLLREALAHRAPGLRPTGQADGESSRAEHPEVAG
jgi:RNA polymerase sigma-70 factor (ECF subfamily)